MGSGINANVTNIHTGPLGALANDPDLILLTSEDYAKIGDRSERVVERERADGTGCPFVKIGRRVFYRLSDVRAFVASRVRMSTSEAA